ncbi:MAG: hypothetical protein WBA54_02215 [Acidaminobacteraceae bacterium]
MTLEETPSNFISSLKTYVEDFGGGLFVAGGDKSYIVEKLEGVFIEESSEVFTDIASKVYDKKEFSDIILIIAIFVFILDVYVRRFRNDKFTGLITKINFKVSDKLKEVKKVKENKSDYLAKTKNKVNITPRSESPMSESSSVLAKKDKKRKILAQW